MQGGRSPTGVTPHIGSSRKQPADDPLIRCRSLFKQTEPPLYSQNLGDALDPANTASGAWVDSAYRSAEIEAAVADAANRSHPIQGYE
jgi:hypothetical protein